MAKKRNAPLRIDKMVRRELIAAAKDEGRRPGVMLNVLLLWALEQRQLLGFDISKLWKVHLSVSDEVHEERLLDPWNHVISGQFVDDEQCIFKLVVR